MRRIFKKIFASKKMKKNENRNEKMAFFQVAYDTFILRGPNQF